jgi:hypothetical protein
MRRVSRGKTREEEEKETHRVLRKNRVASSVGLGEGDNVEEGDEAAVSSERLSSACVAENIERGGG